eukprot:jgi/Chlat1/3211/Chrsp22S03497
MLHLRPEQDPDALKEVALLPHCFQGLFSFRQDDTSEPALLHNMLTNYLLQLPTHLHCCTAPTGAGKTVIFELAILRVYSKYVRPDGSFMRNTSAREKVVYIAPLKALVQEKQKEWQTKFSGQLGLVCKELTSDSDVGHHTELSEADIILATPEKFDSITRKHKDRGGMSFFGDIALLLIDEVHILNDSRGPAVEAIVCRLKLMSKFPALREMPVARLRFAAISATIPNVHDIGEWLGASGRGIKSFGEELRPVKLITIVNGYPPAKNDFMFEKKLEYYLLDVIVEHSRGKPALVFCSTRKGSEDAAVFIVNEAAKTGRRSFFVRSQAQHERLQAVSERAKHTRLQMCIRDGIAFHSAALDAADRALVEQLFSDTDVRVICTTSTLAQGLNLPAHLVVIKSTQQFDREAGGYVEYERSTCLQMIGRAGRPQFDDCGTAVIMTHQHMVNRYRNLTAGAEAVESQLATCLAEHLNAEIVLRTVLDVGAAIGWLKSSFLYVRIKKNSKHYQIKDDLTPAQLEHRLKEMTLKCLNDLAACGMILMDEDGFAFSPCEPGRLMARYYLSLRTMRIFVNAKPGSTLPDILTMLSLAEEFSWIRLRRHEKKVLNVINQDTSGRIKYPVVEGAASKPKKRLQTGPEKVVVLINEGLSCEHSGTLDFALNQVVCCSRLVDSFTSERLGFETCVMQELNQVLSHGVRIVECMANYFAYKRSFAATCNALTFAKCLRQKMWSDTQHVLKQLQHIGPITSKASREQYHWPALVAGGIDSFDKLAAADPRRLEVVTGRKYPFGNQIKESLKNLPPCVNVQLSAPTQLAPDTEETTVTVTRLQEGKSTVHHQAVLIAGNTRDDTILLHQTMTGKVPESCSSGVERHLELMLVYYKCVQSPDQLHMCSSPYKETFQVTWPPNVKSMEIVVNVIVEGYVGLDASARRTLVARSPGGRGYSRVYQDMLNAGVNPNHRVDDNEPQPRREGDGNGDGVIDLIEGDVDDGLKREDVEGVQNGDNDNGHSDGVPTTPDSGREHASDEDLPAADNSAGDHNQADARLEPQSRPQGEATAPAVGTAKVDKGKRCNCRCKDKRACKHLCCKQGLNLTEAEKRLALNRVAFTAKRKSALQDLPPNYTPKEARLAGDADRALELMQRKTSAVPRPSFAASGSSFSSLSAPGCRPALQETNMRPAGMVYGTPARPQHQVQPAARLYGTPPWLQQHPQAALQATNMRPAGMVDGTPARPQHQAQPVARLYGTPPWQQHPQQSSTSSVTQPRNPIQSQPIPPQLPQQPWRPIMQQQSLTDTRQQQPFITAHDRAWDAPSSAPITGRLVGTPPGNACPPLPMGAPRSSLLDFIAESQERPSRTPPLHPIRRSLFPAAVTNSTEPPCESTQVSSQNQTPQPHGVREEMESIFSFL